MVADPSIEKCNVDGSTLCYNPQFVLEQARPHLMAIVAHETMHCALGHCWRRGNRDGQEWNISTDLAINGELAKAGFQLPPDVLIDPQYEGLSAEVIYAKRAAAKRQQPQQQQQSGQGKPDKAPSTGTVSDAPQPQGKPGEGSGKPGPARPGMTEEDWKIVGEQASNVCRKAGTLPADAARAAKAARESREDYRAIIREYVQATNPSDYTWSRPNRRFIASGLYLPGIDKEPQGIIDWITDTSGSIDERLLSIAWAEFAGLVRECKPERVRYWGCDTRAHLIGTYDAETIPDTPPAHMGGGGTRFQPAFDAIAETGEDPELGIYFTDLESADTPREPAYPVLWLTDLTTTARAPWGRTVHVDTGD
jgi:predicted metal-dependent peptidase